MHDSDLKSHENWRNKGLKDNIFSVPIIEKDEIDQVSIEVSNYNIQISDTSRSLTHCYDKTSKINSIQLPIHENHYIIDDSGELTFHNKAQKPTLIDNTDENNVNDIFPTQVGENNDYFELFWDDHYLETDFNNNQKPLSNLLLYKDTINIQKPLSASSPFDNTQNLLKLECLSHNEEKKGRVKIETEEQKKNEMMSSEANIFTNCRNKKKVFILENILKLNMSMLKCIRMRKGIIYYETVRAQAWLKLRK